MYSRCFKTCTFNWFELVSQLKSKLDVTDIVIDQLLHDFGSRLSSLPLNKSDQLFYLEKQCIARIQMLKVTIVSESECSEQEIWCKGVESVLGPIGGRR